MGSERTLWIHKVVNVRVRLIPIVIFSATLLLTVRMLSFWNALFPSVQVQSSQASDPKKDPPSEKREEKSTPSPGKISLPPKQSPNRQKLPLKGIKGQEKGKKEEKKVFDPLELSASEVKLLQELAKRRDQLSLQEKELTSKKETLKAIEARLDLKLNELKEIKGKIDAAFDKDDEKEKIKIDKLVKLYEGMKPKDAAKIMQDLHVEVIVRILEQMKDKIGSTILSKMDAENARFVTAKLVERRRLSQVLEEKGKSSEKN